MKKLVFREEELSFCLFNPVFFHLYDKEKREDVNLFTDIH